MDYIELTINELQSDLQALEKHIQETNIAIGVLKEMGAKLSAQAHRTATVRPRSKAASQTKKTKPKQRPGKFSQYKGVYDGKRTSDGRQRYMAQIWKNGSGKSLGTFYSEEEAAAAIAEAKGLVGEAERLRDLARQKKADEQEQQENNPDRPGPQRRKKTDPKSRSSIVYVCDHCGLKYAESRPQACPGCNSASFRVEKAD